MNNNVTKDVLKMLENFLFKNGWTVEYMSQRFYGKGKTNSGVKRFCVEVYTKDRLQIKGTTTCIIRKGDTKVIGRSYCSMRDNYNRVTGRYIALKRAMNVADIKQRRQMISSSEISILEDGRYAPEIFLSEGCVDNLRNDIVTGEQEVNLEKEMEVNC